MNVSISKFDIQHLCRDVCYGGYKTVSQTVGLQKFARVQISILKLANGVFPAYSRDFTPVVDTLSQFRLICHGTMIIHIFGKIAEAKKMTLGHLFQVLTSFSMTIYFLKTVEILPKQSEYSSQIGSKGGSAIFKAIWKLLANQPKNTWILLGSTFCLGGLLIDYYQARHERSKGLCWDKCLLCANQISRIAIIVLAGRLSPLLVGGLDLTISLTSYTRFLMTAKS